MVTERELFESPDLTPLQFSLWGWMKSAVHKRKVNTQDKWLVRILGAAACINTCEDELRWTTHNLYTRVAKCTEIDSGILGHLLCTVTNLSLKHEIKIKIKLTVRTFFLFYYCS